MKLCVKVPRPTCNTDGCNENVVAIKNFYNEEGNKVAVSWRKFCSKCHNKRTAAKHGLDKITEITARRNGFNSVADYINSKHPSRWYRLNHNYCENIDGRLGFKCTTTIVWSGMLDVDHIDGNSGNEVEENFQTLCKCCHAYKTNREKDYLSPGRKKLKEQKLKNLMQVGMQ